MRRILGRVACVAVALLALGSSLGPRVEAKVRRVAAPDSITVRIAYRWWAMSIDDPSHSGMAHDEPGKWDSLTWRVRSGDLLPGSKRAGTQLRLWRILSRDSACITFQHGALMGPEVVKSRSEFGWDSVIVSSSATRLTQGFGGDLWSELMVRTIRR